jgi:dihydrofolate synthase / folylpolyglutamate synthase
MNYQQAVEFLYSQLPMFQRVGAPAFKKDLKNTIAFCEKLGKPQDKLKAIHIAGTNGKGSTSHFIASILQSAGYKTGLYTSPHLKSFTERIRINGEEIQEQAVVDFVQDNKVYIELIEPSFFETTVAMAFHHFAQQEVDFAVIEVGMGGRFDSTNVINPILSVITNIGFDHMAFLGNTLPEIAFEKAGIIKPNVPVVISKTQSETQTVFLKKAEHEIAPISFADQHISLKIKEQSPFYLKFDVYVDGEIIFENLESELTGNYQIYNIPGVIGAVLQLRKMAYHIPDSAVHEGLSKVKSLSGIKGRWQKIGDMPIIICDTAHNEDGIREIIEQLKGFKALHYHFVLGMVKDKDVRKVLSLFPENASYYFCQANLPRALPAAELAQIASELGLKGVVEPDVNKSLDLARLKAKQDEVIFVGGSTFTVAELDCI